MAVRVEADLQANDSPKAETGLNVEARGTTEEGLTSAASKTVVASGLDYSARVGVGLWVEPVLLAALGPSVFGIWQILRRVVTYMSAADGRPTQALKWVIANYRFSEDHSAKRRAIGSAVLVWLLFSPLILAVGGFIVWVAPYLTDVDPSQAPIVRIAAGVLVLNFMVSGLVGLPHAVLRGMNLGYKRMGVGALLVVVGGCLVVVAATSGWGLIGIALALLTTTLLTAGTFWFITKRLLPWLGVDWPSRKELRKFLSYSGWLLAAIVASKAMLTTDVILVGLILSSASVAQYTLTASAPHIASGIAALVLAASLPGLGGLMGKAEFERAAVVRGEMMAFTWLMAAVMGCTTLIWNSAFVSLWVGSDMFAGQTVNLLLVLLTVQVIFTRNDDNVIDLSLNVRAKALLSALAVVISLSLAVLFGHRFGMGGLIAGFFIGRLIVGISYPVLAGRRLEIPLVQQLLSVLRPGLVLISLYVIALYAAQYFSANRWPTLILGILSTALVVLVVAWFGGLGAQLRRQLIARGTIMLKQLGWSYLVPSNR